MTLNLSLETVGQTIILLVECIADISQIAPGFGCIDLGVGLTCPEGDVVQADALLLRTSINSSSQRSVPDDQSLLEIAGRTVVVKGKGLGGN